MNSASTVHLIPSTTNATRASTSQIQNANPHPHPISNCTKPFNIVLWVGLSTITALVDTGATISTINPSSLKVVQPYVLSTGMSI
jgi:hypothetical protein